MNSNEIRIGNLVYPKGSSTLSHVTGIFENLCCLSGINNKYSKHYLFEQISPIELSESILEKFKFKKDEHGYWWIEFDRRYLSLIPSQDGYWYPVLVQCPEVSSESEQHVSINRIKYAHQIQNLFFSISHLELVFETKIQINENAKN
ncbi:hypothetical protein [Echinicola strongylocentroti]|nr:hypothetical protein [Echinicola strongylocentroti]